MKIECHMKSDTEIVRNFNWMDFSPNAGWESWCAAKNRVVESLSERGPVKVESLVDPDAEALEDIQTRCALTNFALYETAREAATVEGASAALAQFAARLGFSVAEDHRSMGHARVVALRTSSDEGKKGYIPYTSKPMNWHTDGYYNDRGSAVQGFILHCHQQAPSGGVNQFVDPEIAYMRMRAANPDWVRALMNPQAMTIPENREPDGSLRPASVGPVFFADPATGRLQMRYTARTRSIEWRDDPVTRAAADWLRDWLMSGDPMMRTVRLAPGEGIVSNNVLHNRTGFEDGGDEGGRVLLRVRFHERVAEVLHGAA